MLKTLFFLLTILFLNSCGNSKTSVEQQPLKTLYFIDAPVNGIDYECGKRKDVTKNDEVDGISKDGVLYCRKEKLTFSLGSLVLGSIDEYKDGQEIHPQDLVGVPEDNVENERVIKIALLVQSLDDDGDIEDKIIISEDIKNRLTIHNLDSLSIDEINELIRTLGKTPREIKDVQQHLMRYSTISYVGAKPFISPFSEEIPISSPAGYTIGQLTVDEGDSKLTSLKLTGEGAENFQLNSDGKLLLLKKIDTPKIYRLKVIAENIFGLTEESITIEVTKSSKKLAKAQLGLLTGATVKIIKLNTQTNKEELIYTEQTSSTGTFNSHAEDLDDSNFYIFEVSDGMDIDTNSDGIKDETATPNRGALRLIAKGSWIKNANGIVRVTPLSEMQYDYVVKYIKGVDSFDYNKIETVLNESSRVLLAKDLTGDEVINTKDILGFNPTTHQKSLYKTIKNSNLFQKITDKIRDNDTSYIKDFFFSCIIKTFENTDSFEIEGSFVYAYGDNYFYIYDIVNMKRVSEIYLPKTYDNSYHAYYPPDYSNIVDLRPKIYLDLNNNLVYLSSLDAYTIPINIKDINNPNIEYHYIVGAGKYILKKYKNKLFFSEGIPSFFGQKDLSSTPCGDGGCIGIKYDNSDFNYTVGDATAIDITEPYNLLIFTENNFPFFEEIVKHPNKLIGYTRTVADDITYIGHEIYAHREYDVNAYNITNVQKEQSVGIETRYRIKDYNNRDYFDEAGYFYTTDTHTANREITTLNIYKLSDTLEHKGVLEMGNNYIYNILNRYGQTLYINGTDVIYFINIFDSEEPYLYNRVYTGYLRAGSFKFYDTIFRTKKNIVDLKSFIYSSPYITAKETLNKEEYDKLDLKMFERFSN